MLTSSRPAAVVSRSARAPAARAPATAPQRLHVVLPRLVAMRADVGGAGADSPAEVEENLSKTNTGRPKAGDAMDEARTNKNVGQATKMAKEAGIIGGKADGDKQSGKSFADQAQEGAQAAEQKVQDQIEARKESGVDRFEEGAQKLTQMFGAAPATPSGQDKS